MQHHLAVGADAREELPFIGRIASIALGRIVLLADLCVAVWPTIRPWNLLRSGRAARGVAPTIGRSERGVLRSVRRPRRGSEPFARLACSIVLALAVAATSCNGADEGADEGALTVHVIDWNPAKTDVGSVSVVAEFDRGVVTFGERGAAVLVGGVVVARHALASTWRAAALIPAGDASAAPWLVAVTGAGRVLRLRSGYDFDDVTDRYHLGDTPVLSVVALGPTAAVFTYAQGFAVVEGATITRYEGAVPSPAGGVRLASIPAADTVRVFDPRSGAAVGYTVRGVTSVALDASGRLVAITPTTLYEESEGELRAVFSSRIPLHGLAVQGRRVWFGIGTELGVYEAAVSTTRGARLPSDAVLTASPGGVWALSTQGLEQYVDAAGVTADQIAWERTVRPVFARRCGACHLPGGSADLDLSTYASWQTRRPAIRRRVLRDRTMPPTMSTPLTASEASAVAAWSGVDPS